MDNLTEQATGILQVLLKEKDFQEFKELDENYNCYEKKSDTPDEHRKQTISRLEYYMKFMYKDMMQEAPMYSTMLCKKVMERYDYYMTKFLEKQSTSKAEL